MFPEISRLAGIRNLDREMPNACTKLIKKEFDYLTKEGEVVVPEIRVGKLKGNDFQFEVLSGDDQTSESSDADLLNSPNSFQVAILIIGVIAPVIFGIALLVNIFAAAAPAVAIAAIVLMACAGACLVTAIVLAIINHIKKREDNKLIDTHINSLAQQHVFQVQRLFNEKTQAIAKDDDSLRSLYLYQIVKIFAEEGETSRAIETVDKFFADRQAETKLTGAAAQKEIASMKLALKKVWK